MLDTDIASYAMDSKSVILLQQLRHVRPDTLCISVVTAAELLFGSKHLSQPHPSKHHVERFLASASILSWDVAAAHAYADIRYSLQRSGQPIGKLDMMIAAHALSADLTLVSNNTRHYERLAPPLRLENWTQP